MSLTDNPFIVCTHVRADGLATVCVVDKEYPERVAFSLLNKMAMDFEAECKDWSASTQDRDLTPQFMKGESIMVVRHRLLFFGLVFLCCCLVLLSCFLFSLEFSRMLAARSIDLSVAVRCPFAVGLLDVQLDGFTIPFLCVDGLFLDFLLLFAFFFSW